MLELCIFNRPARVIETDDEDDEPETHRLPELRVVHGGQAAWFPWATRGSWPGRARVIDLWTLLVDGIPKAHGDRRFVMGEAHRASQEDEYGQLPFWMRQTTRRARVKALRNTQRHNDRRWRRKSNRKRRKAASRRFSRWIRGPWGAAYQERLLRLIFRDALYPQILFKMDPAPQGA